MRTVCTSIILLGLSPIVWSSLYVKRTFSPVFVDSVSRMIFSPGTPRFSAMSAKTSASGLSKRSDVISPYPPEKIRYCPLPQLKRSTAR